MQEATVDLSRDIAALTSQVQSLSEQVAALTEQTTFLTEQARLGARRQGEWEDLKADMTPVVNDVYLLTVEQLAEIEQHVRLDDIIHLLKRLARNTGNFERLLDQLESMEDLVADAGPLVHDVFDQSVMTLDEMERKGYFGFAREAVGIADKVVEEFSEEDVRQLGDNVVLILNTVKAMTQPEIMNLVNNITVTYRSAEADELEMPTSTLGLLRQMRDPEVRRGLALTMRMLKVVSQGQPPPALANGNGAAAASS